MIQAVILIVIGFVLLIKGADWLVGGASSIAKKFHIPEIIIGLTIVSIGTSMPEIFVSTKSALSGHSDMAMGNVIGSNVYEKSLSKNLNNIEWIKERVKIIGDTITGALKINKTLTVDGDALFNANTRMKGILKVGVNYGDEGGEIHLEASPDTPEENGIVLD